VADTYKVKEVAEKLDCVPMTVYRMIREGKIPAVRIGRDFRIPKKAMDKWFEEEAMKPKKSCKRIPKKIVEFHSYKIGVKGNLSREVINPFKEEQKKGAEPQGGTANCL